MRFITISLSLATLLFVLFAPAKTCAAEQYVLISEPFVNVYEFLDPKSPVLCMVKKNDRLELILAGSKWFQVKVGSSQGWVERKAGHIVDGPSFVSPLIMIIAAILLIAGTLYGVSYYIKKQKNT